MKKILLTLTLIVPIGVMAQKEIKPNLPKAEKAFREGKVDEAKAIIDVTTANEKFLANPKAWYWKGMIYMSMDTTNNEKFMSLDPDPYKVAMESFNKAYELDKGKSESFINDAMGFPLLKSQVNGSFANALYGKAVIEYQDKKDNKKAFEYVKKTIELYPDTVFLNPGGTFFAPQAEEYDKAIEWIKMYQEKGGKSEDSYGILFGIYRDRKKDNEMAFKILEEAKAKYPNNSDFPKYQLNLLINMKRYDDARKMIEADLKVNPNDKESLFLLGSLSKELGDIDGAKTSFQKAFDLDPTFFDAIGGLTDLYWLDCKKVKDEMGKLGISKDDMQKRIALDKIYVEKLNIYIPYLKKCEKLQPDNINILYQSLTVYADLDNQAEVARVKKSLKRLGEEVD